MAKSSSAGVTMLGRRAHHDVRLLWPERRGTICFASRRLRANEAVNRFVHYQRRPRPGARRFHDRCQSR